MFINYSVRANPKNPPQWPVRSSPPEGCQPCRPFALRLGSLAE